ncbi:hypothetical protein BDD12DRAFT_811123 [Trichophaea hybrida]|nr:hypothetical protein BDD12DRAFT_811123 [Trichophaea hybrida]
MYESAMDWSRPSSDQSARILDRSDPGPKFTWTGPGLDWTGPVRTSPHPDYWNHCPVVNEEIHLGKMGLKLYRGLVMPIAFFSFKEDHSHLHTLSPSAPPPNRLIASTSAVLIFSTRLTKEEEPSDPSPEIPDTQIRLPMSSLKSSMRRTRLPLLTTNLATWLSPPHPSGLRLLSREESRTIFDPESRREQAN